jgi:hypothetical protein
MSVENFKELLEKVGASERPFKDWLREHNQDYSDLQVNSFYFDEVKNLFQQKIYNGHNFKSIDYLVADSTKGTVFLIEDTKLFLSTDKTDEKFQKAKENDFHKKLLDSLLICSALAGLYGLSKSLENINFRYLCVLDLTDKDYSYLGGSLRNIIIEKCEKHKLNFKSLEVHIVQSSNFDLLINKNKK